MFNLITIILTLISYPHKISQRYLLHYLKSNAMKYIYLLFTTIVVFSSCKQEQKSQDPELKEIIERNTIVIKGSDTELPMVRDLSKAFSKACLFFLSVKSVNGSFLNFECDIIFYI